MKIILYLVVLLLLLLFINSIHGDDKSSSSSSKGGSSSLVLNSLKPLQIHLSFTNKENQVMATWLTLSRINTPTVYYYTGSCEEVRNSDDSTLQSLMENLPTMRLAIGESKTYSSYDGFVHHVVMDHLIPSEHYCYTVGGEFTRDLRGNASTSWSDWSSFKTASQRGEASVFAAIADSGTYGGVFDVVKALEKDNSLSLLIHGGDLSYGKNEEKWDLFGDIFEPVTKKLPMMVIPGNWDVKEGAIAPYYNRYKMPLVKNNPSVVLNADGTTVTYYNLYYSFQYSYVYHIMLSSYDPYHNGSSQYIWLENELRKANALRDDYPWIIVSAHSPMYSSSTGHNGSDTIFRGQLEQLFRINQVNLVLSGHDHGYERTYPVYNEYSFTKHPRNYTTSQGTIHIVVGTGGADSDPWMDRPSWTAHRETSTGYTKITAHKHTLQITYIRSNGSVGDDLYIVNSYSSYSSTAHAPFIIIFLVFLTVVFPLCAYNRIPQRIFSAIMGNNSRIEKNYRSIA